MAAEALPGTARAKTHSEGFRSTMDQIRTRTDTTAKALAAIGTAAVGAVGYAKFADVFPYGGPLWALLALFAGVVAMGLAVGLLVRRFFDASQVLITNPDLCATIELNRLNERERVLLEGAYADSAKANGVESLSALEESGMKLEKDALAESDPEKAKAGHSRAERIFAEVQAAQDRAAAFIMRRRATYALFGWRSLLLLGLFVAGWYGTALGADAIEGGRTGEVEVAKSCAEAREKKDIVKGELPSICGKEEEKPEEEASAGKTAADGVAALAAAHASCLQVAEKRKEKPQACASLARALEASTAAAQR